MTKITAIGQKWGKKLTVEVTRERKGEKIKILFNGKEEPYLVGEMETAILMAPYMANCYTPPKDSMLAYYNALSNSFYEKVESVDVKGRIEQIPTHRPKNGEIILY